MEQLIKQLMDGGKSRQEVAQLISDATALSPVDGAHQLKVHGADYHLAFRTLSALPPTAKKAEGSSSGRIVGLVLFIFGMIGICAQLVIMVRSNSAFAFNPFPLVLAVVGVILIAKSRAVDPSKRIG